MNNENLSALYLGDQLVTPIATLPMNSSTRDVGDIFWTTRTDTQLNGAVIRDGSSYNFADVNGGDNNIQTKLLLGQLKYVSRAEYTQIVAENGECESWGWDGEDDTGFIVPTALLRTLDVGEANIPMVQLFTGITDNALATATGVIADIAQIRNDMIDRTGTAMTGTLADSGEAQLRNISVDKTNLNEGDYLPKGEIAIVPQGSSEPLVDYVIDWQKPTADNNYTWYRLYQSGWVEQGGYIVSGTSTTQYAVTLPVEMSHTEYWKSKLLKGGISSANGLAWSHVADKISTAPDDTTTVAYFDVVSNGYADGVWWEVKGYAA